MLTRVAVVLDVGANVGQYGDLVFSTGFEGTLISFEAIEGVHRRLARHARQRSKSWIVAPCCAVGSQRGSGQINISENEVSSSLLPMHRKHVEAAPESRYVEKQTVGIERLDVLVRDLLPPSGDLLIKVDAQGYEMEVLKGAEELLPRTAAIQVELSLVPLYDGAPGFVELINFIESKSFKLFSLVPGFKDKENGQLLQMDGFFVRKNIP